MAVQTEHGDECTQPQGKRTKQNTELGAISLLHYTQATGQNHLTTKKKKEKDTKGHVGT